MSIYNSVLIERVRMIVGTFNKFRKIFLTPSLLWQLNMNWTCTTRHPLHPGKMDGRWWQLSFVCSHWILKYKLILIIMMVILYREWWKAVEKDRNRFMTIHDNCTVGIAVVQLEEPSRCKFPRVQPRQWQRCLCRREQRLSNCCCHQTPFGADNPPASAPPQTWKPCLKHRVQFLY